MDTARVGERVADDDYEVLALARVGLILFVEAALFLTVVTVCAAIAPDYLIHSNNLSEFGAVTATATLFNISLIGVGLLNFLAAYFCYRSNSGQFTTIIFVLAGIGAAGAGALNVGVERHLHAVLASIGFLGHLSMPFAFARLGSGGMRLVSYLAGLLSIVFLLVWIVGMSGFTGVLGAIGTGGTQLMIMYPLALWMIGFGGYLMASHKRPAPS